MIFANLHLLALTCSHEHGTYVCVAFLDSRNLATNRTDHGSRIC